MVWLTNLPVEDGLQGHRILLKRNEHKRWSISKRTIPDVLLMRNLAFVRLAKPSMFSVPMKEVLMVFTALN
jgi:hypothetical protein